MKICVLGLGYVGLPVYCLAKMKGFDVFGFDIDYKKVESLKGGQIKVESRVVEKAIKHKIDFNFTSNPDDLKKADSFIICVPTPVNNKKEPDYSFVISAIESIIKQVSKRPILISIESTINPGTCEEVIKPIFDRHTLEIDKDYYLAHCPERVDPGNKKWDVDNLPRVLGALSEESLDKAYSLYSKLIDADIKKVSSIKAAEMSKIVENTFRDINIAYVNQLAKIAYAIGVDIKEVIDAASTKPFAFMAHYPGIGVGGHCIPVDPYYLIEYSKMKGYDPKFLVLAREVNESMPFFAVSILQDALNELKLALKDTKVLLLGFSYKENVSDLRETPAKPLYFALKDKKAIVKIYDPFVKSISDFASLDDALLWADAVILVTAHNLFKKEIPQVINKYRNVRVFVDGRNVFDKKIFEMNNIIYKGIGR